ncbi:MAG: helix-hairpin-helix domain-containing protein, partial [Anaerolineaceae bacterium]
VVHVDGQVIQPGVYKLEPGSRVVDAIQAAGGFSIEANTAAINQADLVNDGSRIVVPRIGESAVVEDEIVTFTGGLRADMININLASEEQLDTLPDIGPKTAQQIILYRQEHGNFVRIEDIMNVPGIGQATFDKIRDLIEVE